MSKCSKKCNEIKQKIDSISGLDDDFIYNQLIQIETFADSKIKYINEYADEDKLNGTCFKEKRHRENNRLEKIEFERDMANKVIDEMAQMLEGLKLCYFKKEDGGELLGKYRYYNKEDWKQYFKEKVEGKQNENND